MGNKLELTRVHVLEKIPGSSMQFKLVRTQPVLRLCHEDEVVYIQKGTLFSAGGDPLPKDGIPGWFADEVKNCNPVVLREVGFAPKGA